MLSGVTGARARTVEHAGTTVVGQVDPTALAEVSVALRVAGAFVLILLFGGVLLTLSAGFVERATDASMERPLSTVLYGVFAQIGLAFLGIYGHSQLVQLGSFGPVLGAIALWVVAVAALALSSLGFVVVGAAITDVAGGRQLWPGLAIGAAVGAAAWLVPSVSLALLVWVLVVSVGVGGPTRVWFHDSAGGDVR